MTITSMSQPTLPAQSEEAPAEDVILGVDTYKDVQVAAVVTVLGAFLAHQEFPVTAAGYRQLPSWVVRASAASRSGVHRLLRSGTDTLLEAGEHPGHRGQSA